MARETVQIYVDTILHGCTAETWLEPAILYMRAAGATDAALAGFCGVSPTTFSKWAKRPGDKYHSPMPLKYQFAVLFLIEHLWHRVQEPPFSLPSTGVSAQALMAGGHRLQGHLEILKLEEDPDVYELARVEGRELFREGVGL